MRAELLKLLRLRPEESSAGDTAANRHRSVNAEHKVCSVSVHFVLVTLLVKWLTVKV